MRKPSGSMEDLTKPSGAKAATFSKFYVVRPTTLSDPRYGSEVRAVTRTSVCTWRFALQQPVESLLERQTGRDGGRRVKRDEVGFALDASGDGRFGLLLPARTWRPDDGWDDSPREKLQDGLGWCLGGAYAAHRIWLECRIPHSLGGDQSSREQGRSAD